MHVMVPPTGLWPVDATPLALPRGGLEEVTPSTIRRKKKEIRKTLDIIWLLIEVKFIE